MKGFKKVELKPELDSFFQLESASSTVLATVLLLVTLFEMRRKRNLIRRKLSQHIVKQMIYNMQGVKNLNNNDNNDNNKVNITTQEGEDSLNKRLQYQRIPADDVQ